MAKELIIYGAGYPDIVKLIHAINQKEHTWDIKGFIDDTPDKQGADFPIAEKDKAWDGAGQGIGGIEQGQIEGPSAQGQKAVSQGDMQERLGQQVCLLDWPAF